MSVLCWSTTSYKRYCANVLYQYGADVCVYCAGLQKYCIIQKCCGIVLLASTVPMYSSPKENLSFGILLA
jgi:hypothetical protein